MFRSIIRPCSNAVFGFEKWVVAQSREAPQGAQSALFTAPFHQRPARQQARTQVPTSRPITPQALQDRLASLALSLSVREDALALLALGSVGAETDRLDAWSDLDFFVLVSDGAKARYIQNLD
jgi:hypothetical protein